MVTRWDLFESFLRDHEPLDPQAAHEADASWSIEIDDFDRNNVSQRLAEISTWIPTLGPYAAGRLSLFAGSLVEQFEKTIDPGVLYDLSCQVVECVDRLMTIAAPLFDKYDPDDDDFDEFAHADEFPKSAIAIRSGHHAILAAMTTLCRSVDARVEARKNLTLLKRIERTQYVFQNGDYLQMLMSCMDRFRITVLHWESKRAFDVELTGVRNGFHFFSLLQNALSDLHTEPYDPTMVDLLYARSWSQPSDSDHARWSFVTTAGCEHGELTNNMMATAWGEVSLGWVPTIDDIPVVILAPIQIARSWSCNFVCGLHSAHLVECNVEELGTEEAMEWFSKV